MSLLLDTHAVLYWFDETDRLGEYGRKALSTAVAPIHVSAVSVFEIVLKHRLGKLPQAAPFADQLPDVLLEQGFLPLPVSALAAATAARFPSPHRDPFDRLLAAQAIVEDMVLLSNDTAMDSFGVTRAW